MKKLTFMLLIAFLLLNVNKVKSQENKLINLINNISFGDGNNEILLQISNDSIFGLVDGFGTTLDYIASMYFETKLNKNIATGVFTSDDYQKTNSPIELIFLNDTMYLTLYEIKEYKKIPFYIPENEQEITEIVNGNQVGINLYLDNIISDISSNKKYIKKLQYNRYALDNMNLREGQSTISKVIMKINKGDEVRMLELGKKVCINKVNGLWVKVDYKGKIGWVFSKNLSVTSPNQEWNTY